jgi:AraC-like DNA-binding protein
VPFELPLVRLIANYNAIFEIIRQMFDPVNDTLESGIRRKGLFLQALPFCLNKPASVKSCMSPVLLKAKEYMDTNFKDPGLNITKIAASNCVTSNHLCRVFNRELGISPLSYLKSRRIKQAQELLLTTAMNVAQIAFEAGFNDPNYFSRVFKNKTGISPSCFALSRQRNSVHKLDS